MPETPRAPRSVLVTALLSVAEAVVAAIVTGISMIGSAAQASVDNLGVELFWIAAAVLVAWIAWQYVRARPWARTAIVTWHLLVVFSLISLLRFMSVLSTVDRIGVVVGILASLTAVGLVFTREARAHIVDTRADILD